MSLSEETPAHQTTRYYVVIVPQRFRRPHAAVGAVTDGKPPTNARGEAYTTRADADAARTRFAEILRNKKARSHHER